MSSVVLGLLAALPFTQPAQAGVSSLPSAAFDDLAFDQRPGAHVPSDVRLRDESGRPVRLGSLLTERRRPTVLVFDYFGCKTLCGLVLGDLATALHNMPLTPGRDYGVLAVSMDPRDSPRDATALKAKHFEADDAIAGATRFLVGDASEIKRLAEAVGFSYRYDADIDQYAHPAGLVILTPAGTIARYLLGVGYKPLDLRLGLLEAGQGAIAAPASRLLLLCYGYDPAHGTYGLLIGRLMQLVGIGSVALIGGIWLLASRGRR